MRRPFSWELVRLSDVCRINPRLEPSEKPDDKLPVSFVPMSAIDEVFGQIVNPETRPYDKVSKGFTPFKEGDVLFAKITPCMENGKAAIAKGLVNRIGFGSTEFHVLRPSTLLLGEYLFFFIRQKVFRNYARAAFTGSAGQQRVLADFLERVKMPLPTMIEQQHIVMILQHAEELRRLRHGTMESVKGLNKILFLETFGDPSPKRDTKWEIVSLGNLVCVETGGTPSRSNPDNFGGRINWIKSTELIDEVIEDSEEKITESGMASSNTKLFPPETILVAMYGQGQTRGRTGKLMVPATCNQACVCSFAKRPPFARFLVGLVSMFI